MALRALQWRPQVRFLGYYSSHLTNPRSTDPSFGHPSDHSRSRSALPHLVAACGGVPVRLDWPALTPALTEIRLFNLPVPSGGLVAPSQSAAPIGIGGLAASWLFNPRRQAHFLLARHKLDYPMPNVRAKRETTAGRQARAGENVQRTARPGLVTCRWRSA